MPAPEAGLPIRRFRNHPVLVDFDLYSSAGENSALAYICKCGDTHYLEAGDLERLMTLAEMKPSSAEAQETALLVLGQLGLVRGAALAPSDGGAHFWEGRS